MFVYELLSDNSFLIKLFELIVKKLFWDEMFFFIPSSFLLIMLLSAFVSRLKCAFLTSEALFCDVVFYPPYIRPWRFGVLFLVVALIF